MTTDVIDDRDDRGDAEPAGSTGGTDGFTVVLAVLSAAAGVVHLAMTPSHASDELWHGIGFAVAGWFQLAVAVALLVRPTSKVLVATVVGNVAILGVWVLSRTVGLPGGSHSWHPESVAFIDLATAGMEAALVVGAAVALRRPATSSTSLSRALTPSALVACLAVLALTTAALASPSATHDHHGGHGEDGEAHDHGDDAGEVAEAQTIALEDRCDLEFNTASYYREAQLAGLDPFALQAGGGHGDHHGTTDDGALDHEGHSPEQQAAHEWADQIETEADAAIAEASADHDEGDSARLIVELSLMSDAEYDAALRQLQSQHGASHAPDDTGHGGHDGPSPWTPMTEPAECQQLAEEVEIARDVALAHPTPTEALAAGYVMVTGYVPGIAAHYMNFDYVDGTFEVDKPEMLLYDGTGPEAHMIGLSYYVVHEGESEPTQGFTGDNDHYHRHIGLCIRNGVVVGGSGTSEEQCAALGGTKGSSRGGWMSHAWVVPGCESPWGLFSAANPRLDLQLGRQSGQGEPCAGSVRSYDDTPGPNLDVPAATGEASGGGGEGEEAAED